MRIIAIVIGLVFLFYGFIIANGFPDLDHKLRYGILIQHRSMLTHNALLCVIAIPFGRALGLVGAMGCAGLALGTVVHLGADMFPSSWSGFAYIYVPLLGRLQWVPLDGDWIPTIFSFCWLGINVLLAIGCFAKTVDKEA